MLGSLITLPLRLGVRGAGLALRSAAELTERAAGLAGLLAGTLGRRSQLDEDFDGAPAARSPRTASEPWSVSEPPAPLREAETEPAPPPAPEAKPAPPPPTAETATEAIEAPPAHVSEEPVLVAEVAEAGAEDGAGAQIRVAEPWAGYRQMKAADVIDRISAATAAELAAVALYEVTGRRRKSVLAAAEQALERSARPT